VVLVLYNNKPLTLEIDHIDGKCFNNTLENMRFLCPNCHSQTDTYKAKNKSSDNKKRYSKEGSSPSVSTNFNRKRYYGSRT
jgi:hypothetical protein